MGANIKLAVFVPTSHADQVRQAMGDAGAGALGDYSHSSFSFSGKGRFIPQPGANPHQGEVGKLEVTDEERVEVVVERSQAKAVVAALRAAHPYEEPAFDLIELLDEEDL